MHSSTKLADHQVHQHLWHELKYIFANDCRTIVNTAKGFRTTWFRAVQELNWDIVKMTHRKNYVGASWSERLDIP